MGVTGGCSGGLASLGGCVRLCGGDEACRGPTPAAVPAPHTLAAARTDPTMRYREERSRYCHLGRGFCFTCGRRGHMAWACEEACTIDGGRIAGHEPLDAGMTAVQALAA